MDLIAYAEVRARVLDLIGNDEASTADARTLAKIQRSARVHLETCWQHAYWPELTPIEERYFRASYDNATAYAAGDEVYYAPEQAYYQALTASTGNLPTDLAYWQPCEAAYFGEDWATGTVYAVGDIVRNPADDQFYGCHTAHTAGATFDATKFGLLTLFVPYVALEQTGETEIGEVVDVATANRLVSPNQASSWIWEASPDGVAVPGVTAASVWIEFRRRCPQLYGTTYSASTSYVAGNQVYYSSTNEEGDFWKALTSVTNETPEASPTKWERLGIPRMFWKALVSHIYADLLVGDGQLEKSGAVRQEAMLALATAKMRAKMGRNYPLNQR